VPVLYIGRTVNAESLPVSQLCVNTSPATKVTLITNGLNHRFCQCTSYLLIFSETSAHEIQTSGNHPKERILIMSHLLR
jgi:hypothetical protein